MIERLLALLAERIAKAVVQELVRLDIGKEPPSGKRFDEVDKRVDDSIRQSER